MPNDGVEITGLVETQRMLIEFAGELTSDGMEEALIAGASVVQAELRTNAPRRQSPLKGEREFPPLHESLVTDVRVTKSGGVASTGFGDAGPVALWEELGHRIVSHSGKDSGKVTEPKPFMRRSTDNCADDAIDAFCESILKMLRSRYGRA